MKFICLPLLVTLLVLVQHAGATSTEKKVANVFKEGIKASFSRLAMIAKVGENIAYYSGYEDESKYIAAGGDIITGAKIGYVAGNLPGAVAGAILGAVKWTLWD